MHHDFLDRYSRLNSPVHRMAASLKLVIALSIVALTVAVPVVAISYLATLGTGLLVVAVVALIPLRYLGWRLLLLEPFVLGMAGLTLFQPGGLNVFAGIVVKSTLCLLTMVLLANTTPFAELLRVLRRAGTPPIFVTTLALLYRYLFVLVDEAERMHRARACRTFTNKRSHRWRTLATVVGQLFVRSTERAERIYAAMLARGWQ